MITNIEFDAGLEELVITTYFDETFHVKHKHMEIIREMYKTPVKLYRFDVKELDSILKRCFVSRETSFASPRNIKLEVKQDIDTNNFTYKYIRDDYTISIMQDAYNLFTCFVLVH